MQVFYPPLAGRFRQHDRILTPLTPVRLVVRGSRSKRDYKIVVCPGARLRESFDDASLCGGLKGKQALGDAHPYLALF